MTVARIRAIGALVLITVLAVELGTYGWIAWRHAALWSATGWFAPGFCGGPLPG
jgi:hypothetical protein